MQKLWQVTIQGVKALLIIMITGIILTTAYGVLTRYVLNDAASWTGELATYLLIWITFLGSALAVVEGGHMNFDLIIEKLPPLPRKIVLLIGNLALLYFVGVLTYYGTVVSISTMTDRALTIPVSKLFFYAALPISGVIMLIGYVIDTYKIFAEKSTSLAEDNDANKKGNDVAKEVSV
ncbi:MAG: TRAP transporter small permease [Desulfitobacterium hafniense]|nr:TRAP transporter small permease [Desulfitobacterium hafniense]